ncbi:hypothetical protein LTR36_008028 [Oleoguttula mirabilis]|uniref:RING-type domain-containing protein n=1 Tax=Oleoguttula mirabilis TaxID=1507867 RepID=A0AAV9J8K4_9PEZI|nr:hypothetical protein LTR36_008028 [Oleoguttula mirabilis]
MAPPLDPAPPPSRVCAICTEEPDPSELVRPCRICSMEYCRECIKEMFTGATTDNTRMPPRCCVFLQLHTALKALTETEASNYRTKLDEWITLDKVYCPAPTCSAFISERLLPDVSPANLDGTPTLQSVLSDIVKRVSAAPAARFFRGELDITMLPGYTAVVTNHVDLTSIQAHVEADGYTSVNDLTHDMALIVANAKIYNKPGHPVANTADELYERYLVELAAALDRVISTPSHPVATCMFACPTCHIGICTKCKQVEHGTSACDTTAGDAVLAMLETFRYKRCPLCKHAVRKMYGCSHIQCLCGAHFCYWCCKSINECDGACEARDESDDEEADDEGLSDEDLDDEDDGGDAVADGGSTAQPANEKPADDRPLPHDSPQAQLTIGPTLPTRIVNLDAGGGRRWGEAELDFGEEPEDEGVAQIWSCTHEFRMYYPKDDGLDHGDETKMECNRCFETVLPAKVPKRQPPKMPPHSKKPARGSLLASTMSVAQTGFPLTDGKETDVENASQAWECCDCRLVVCMACRDKYNTR